MKSLSPPIAFFLVTFTTLLLFFPGHCPAADKEGTDSRIVEEQKKVQRIKQGIEGQKKMVKKTREQENSLTSELHNLNQRIQGQNDKLGSLKTEISNHERLIMEKQEETAKARDEKNRTAEHIMQRLLSFYKMGPVGAINVLFSSSTLPELLSAHQYFESLQKHDQQIIREYREKITVMDQAALALQSEKQLLVETLAQVKSQEENLAASRHERMALLQKVKTEKKLYQKALEELEEAADRLTGTIEELKAAKKERRKKTSPESAVQPRPETVGFANQKGKLSPPVSGTVTTLFGKTSGGRFGITTSSNGIDIETAPGTQISAIYDGTVAYAGILRGYGNLLIIDHGQQYYSLVSRAAKFYKQEGDGVAKGEIIGVMSDQEGLLGDGLHFEIRHGTQPENPLSWVNNAKLVIRPKKAATN